MLTPAALAAADVASGVLAVAGVAKLREPASFATFLATLGRRPGRRRAELLARLVGAVEIAVAAAAVLVGGALWLRRPRPALPRARRGVGPRPSSQQAPSCGCFGAASAPTSPSHVVLDLVFAVGAIAAAVGAAAPARRPARRRRRRGVPAAGRPGDRARRHHDDHRRRPRRRAAIARHGGPRRDGGARDPSLAEHRAGRARHRHPRPLHAATPHARPAQLPPPLDPRRHRAHRRARPTSCSAPEVGLRRGVQLPGPGLPVRIDLLRRLHRVLLHPDRLERLPPRHRRRRLVEGRRLAASAAASPRYYMDCNAQCGGCGCSRRRVQRRRARARGAAAPAATATTASGAAPSSATASATSTSPASARSCAGSRRAPRRGSSTGRAPPRRAPTTARANHTRPVPRGAVRRRSTSLTDVGGADPGPGLGHRPEPARRRRRRSSTSTSRPSCRTVANLPRPDVAAGVPVLRRRPRLRRHDRRVPPGRHVVCVLARDQGSGTLKFLASPPSTWPGPVGSLDDVASPASGGAIDVAGWLLDPAPGSARPPPACMVDGVEVARSQTTVARPDVGGLVRRRAPERRVPVPRAGWRRARTRSASTSSTRTAAPPRLGCARRGGRHDRARDRPGVRGRAAGRARGRPAEEPRRDPPGAARPRREPRRGPGADHTFRLRETAGARVRVHRRPRRRRGSSRRSAPSTIPRRSGPPTTWRARRPAATPPSSAWSAPPIPTLLAFLSSGCLTCQEFWAAFADGVGLELDGRPVRIVAVTKGTEQESPGAVAQLAPPDMTTIMSSEAYDDYGVPVSPYFVLVEAHSGAIAGEGAASSWPQLASLLDRAVTDASARRRAAHPPRAAGGVDAPRPGRSGAPARRGGARPPDLHRS